MGEIRRNVVPRMGKAKHLIGVVLLLMLCNLFYTSSIQATTAEQELQFQSESVILIDAETGQVLYAKNAQDKMYPASITKIISGIVALEEGQIEDIVTVSELARKVEGTRVYLEVGEQVTLMKLIQGLLINSGNDAGVAIAEHMDQSEERFAERMNRFVVEKVGVHDTNFTNPHGLFDEDHYTTAYDMAMISKYAMQNDTFREIVGTYELDWVGEGWITTIYNHNRLLNQYEGATGIKNGYVQRSGHTLVGSAKRGDTELIAVTLKAPSANIMYREMSSLLDFGFEHFEKETLSTDRFFFDSEGFPYRSLSDISFSKPSDSELEYQFFDSGLLVVYDQEEQKIFETQLDQVEVSLADRKSSVKISSLQQEEGIANIDSHNQSALSNVAQVITTVMLYFYALFLLLIAYLLIRKKRRDRRNKSPRITSYY